MWYQMPAALGVMMNLLPPEKYRVHLHTAWQDEHAPEVTGLEAKAKLALHQHAEAFAHLRRDETCPICLEALPLANASTKTLPCEESVGGVDVVDSTHADVSTTHAAGERFRDDDTSVDTLVEEEEKADTPTSAAKAEGNLIADASTPPSQESDSASPPKRSSLTMTSYSSVSHDNNGNKSIDSAVGFVTLPCGHAFHTGCCSEWFARSTKCPSCRLVLTTAHVDGAAARLKCLLLEQKNCSKSPSSSSSSTAFPSALDVPLMQEKLELETDLCVPCGPGASPPLLGAHNNSSTEAAGPVLEGSNAASAGIVKVPICNLDSNYENRHVDFADDPIDDSSIDDDGSTSGVGVLSGVSACGKDLAWLVAETVKAGAEAEAAARKGASSSNSAEAEEESDLEEVSRKQGQIARKGCLYGIFVYNHVLANSVHLATNSMFHIPFHCAHCNFRWMKRKKRRLGGDGSPGQVSCL